MLWLIHVLMRSIAILDLLLFTLLMLLLAALPHAVILTMYPSLVHAWCRCFVRALGVQLRLHQHAPLPEQYILIANHPSALEDAVS